MNGESHVYNLDMQEVMTELARALQETGYTFRRIEGELWSIETPWTRGAAYGEIGGMLYSLIARHLEEVGE